MRDGGEDGDGRTCRLPLIVFRNVCVCVCVGEKSNVFLQRCCDGGIN